MAYRQLSDEEALNLAGTTDGRTAVQYPYLLQTFWAPAILRMMDRLMALGLTDLAVLAIDPADAAAPPGVGVLPGACAVGGVVFEYAGIGGAAVMDGLSDGDHLVWAYDDGGTLAFGSGPASSGGAGWPASAHVKLARVSVADGEITSIADLRGANALSG